MNRAVPAIVLLVGVVGAFVMLRTHDKKQSKQPAAPKTVLQIGRAPGPVFSPFIRVNVTPRSSRGTQIAVDGPYVIRPVGSSRILGRGERLERSNVTTNATGLQIGQRSFPVSRLEVIPEKSPSAWVGDHQYRGNIRLFRRASGSVVVVNVLPMEDYIGSVIDSEMPAAFPRAARQAQAIAARTYALYQMQVSSGHQYYDVHATTQSQKYLGYQYVSSSGRKLAGESRESRQISQETRGMICTFDGKLFCTYYSAVCGGSTIPGKQVFSDAAAPLRPVACQWCREAKRYRWQVAFSKDEIGQKLRSHFQSKGKSFGNLQNILSLNNPNAGTEPMVEVSDGRNRQRLPATRLRSLLSTSKLYSPRFEIREEGDQVIIDGRGHGHGVGLCQWGARGLGLAGRDVLAILQHYYPGSRVVVVEADRRVSVR